MTRNERESVPQRPSSAGKAQNGEHAKTFRKAAQKALFEWGREDGLDDLLQELWVWFLERPATQAQFDEQDEPLNRVMAHRAAIQMLSRQTLEADVFDGKSLYSTDSIKDALKGESTNKYLREILPDARESLGARNEDYAEALRSRYEDGVIPQGREQENLLVRAHKAVADEVNVLYLTKNESKAVSTTPGQSRRARSGHRDPTGDIAVGMSAQTREDALHQTPLRVFLHGAAALPMFEMPDGRLWRAQPEDFSA